MYILEAIAPLGIFVMIIISIPFAFASAAFARFLILLLVWRRYAKVMKLTNQLLLQEHPEIWAIIKYDV